MAKLVLVNAGKNYEFGFHEPLHLLVLAAYAKKFGHEVAIADQLSGEDVFKKIKKLNPDFVGITGTTAVIANSYEVSDWCRKNNYKTILGGVHVSVMPEEGLKHADYVVVGEGEKALMKILEGKAKKGIVKEDYIKNLDEIPRINRDLINVSYYQKAKDRSPGSHLHFVPPNTKINSIFSVRGCPYKCIFCHNSWRGLPLRANSSVKIVIEEMKELEDKYNSKAIFFMDDDFLFSKIRAEEFCRLYKEYKLKLIWGCQARVTSPGLNRDTLKKLNESNCKQITFGFESGNQRILSLLKNNTTTIEQNQRAIHLVREAGILVTGSFMIGNPTETEKEIQDTKNFILKNNLIAGVGITTPYPGTKLWQMCAEKKVVPNSINWREFNFHNLTFALNDIPRENMEKIHKEFLELALERNPGMNFENILRATIKHPKKAILRTIKNPKSILTIIKRYLKNGKH
jgi:radical SAM superfamily enzyme YgiQ (UPF0313 family)